MQNETDPLRRISVTSWAERNLMQTCLSEANAEKHGFRASVVITQADELTTSVWRPIDRKMTDDKPEYRTELLPGAERQWMGQGFTTAPIAPQTAPSRASPSCAAGTRMSAPASPVM
jgi:hypothetical protein